MEARLQVRAGAKETEASEQTDHIWNLKIKGRETKLEEAVKNKYIF